MRALIINSSPRKNGLIDRLLETIKDSLPQQCEIDYIYVHSLKASPCCGCMKCRTQNSCILPEDDAQIFLEKIKAADCLIIGTPCYWGNMNGHLKLLFDRIVYGMMDENKFGVPIPLHKGKKAIIVSTSTTLFPFNIWFNQTRGAVKALKEILKWSGFRVVGTLEKGGTKRDNTISNKEKNKCIRLAKKITK